MRCHKMLLSLMLLTALLLSACQPLLLPETPSPEQSSASMSAVPAEEPETEPTPVPQPENLTDFKEVELSYGVNALLGEITSEALASNLLGDPHTRNLFIQLPPNYQESDKRYPVVYVLHYFTGDEISLLLDVGRAMMKSLESGEVNEMILVYPNAKNQFGGSMYMSSPTIGDYETYLTQELVQFIDANFRTLDHRDSRGIMGCSMGGDGSLRLAMDHPDVFSVAAPVSSTPDYTRDPAWEQALQFFRGPPTDLRNVMSLPWQERWYLGLAGVAAPNPDKPPLYLDMPFEIQEGEARIVPEVYEQINALDLVHATHDYLAQPIRLRAILLYHGEYDRGAPVEIVRDFDKLLTELEVDHEYLEMPKKGHCNLPYEPVLRFMSDNLVFDTP